MGIVRNSLLLLAIIAAGAFAGAPAADAASAYDNAVITTTDFSVVSPDTTAYDVTGEWLTRVNSACSASIDFDTYYYSLIRYTESNGYENIQVSWVEKSIYDNNGGHMNWYSNIVTANLSTNNINYTYLYRMNGDADFRVDNCFNGGSITISQNLNPQLNHPSNRYTIFSTYPPEYPAGYEGKLIPEESPAIAEESDWTPKIKLIQGNNWVIEYSDEHFFTFDNTPFICEDDFAPIIEWRIYDITDNPEVLLDTLQYSSSALNTFNAPKVNNDRKYRLEGNYTDCNGWIFTDVSSKEFTVLKDGSLNPPDYQTVCVTDTAPWINWQGCMSMLNGTVAALTFNAMNFNPGSDWSFTNNCRNLQVLGSWIFASGKEICPQIPETIRNIVTPFITLAVGLMVITFISRRGGSGI